MKFCEWMARNRDMEQSLTAILQAEVKIYSAEIGKVSLSAVWRHSRWYRVGTSFLLEQARDEAQRQSNPLYRDTFMDFFGYTDFLYRSNRSVMNSDGQNTRSIHYTFPIP